MATLRELKTRIGSVASTEKITGAMKMISSAKKRKAEMALQKLAPFRKQIENILGNLLGSDATFSSPLSEKRNPEKVAVVVFGSDDGLCGAYNVNVFKCLSSRIEQIREAGEGSVKEITVIPVGTKVAKLCVKLAASNMKVVPFHNVTAKTEGQPVKDFSKELCNAFLNKEYDRIDLVYMRYVSLSKQVPTSEVYLPVAQETLLAEGVKTEVKPYIFEPSAEDIFKSVLPMFLLSTMQEVFVQNRASEQAARILAMQSANDNAKKLLEQLRLEFNKLRQQSITTELLDIVGGQVR